MSASLTLTRSLSIAAPRGELMSRAMPYLFRLGTLWVEELSQGLVG